MTEMSFSFILREIGSALDSLAELAERKGEVIAVGDTPGLDEIVRAEEALSRRLASLEEDRAKAVGMDAPGEPEETETVRVSLRQKAERLKTLNERNQRLLRQGLDVVEFELKLFMPQVPYKGAPRPGPMLFDQRV